ncbi:hypothetical protein F4861DRAFT_534508 [Xylaria intraflava]|nr:hypothetical protein F4861DRAFT_534508 [Xylaria intraflava]
MAPTAQEITKLLEADIAHQLSAVKKSSLEGGLIQVGTLASYFREDVDFNINGQGFALATHVKGSEAIEVASTKSSLPPLAELLDNSKPIEGKVLQVIGGGPDSEWAAAVLKSTATTVKGKPFNHEWVITIKFDDNGKIASIKTYADTLQLQNIIDGN